MRPTASGYPALEDLPQRSDKPAMTADERLKFQKELIGARDRQASRARARQAARSLNLRSPEIRRRASAPRRPCVAHSSTGHGSH